MHNKSTLLSICIMSKVKILFVTVLMLGIGAKTLIAQDKSSKVDDLLYLSVEMLHSGEIFSKSYWETGISEISNIGTNIKFGYDFNPKWKIYANAKIKYLLYNRHSTQNFYTQGELGLGTAYSFYSKDKNVYYEPDVSISSDILKNSPRCLNTRAGFKIGLNSRKYKPYIGLYIEYMSPYKNSAMQQRLFTGIAIGVDLL